MTQTIWLERRGGEGEAESSVGTLPAGKLIPQRGSKYLLNEYLPYYSVNAWIYKIWL